jgi:hypothetical protein
MAQSSLSQIDLEALRKLTLEDVQKMYAASSILQSLAFPKSTEQAPATVTFPLYSDGRSKDPAPADPSTEPRTVKISY